MATFRLLNKTIFTCLLLLLFLAGCIKYEDVQVLWVENVEVTDYSQKGANIEMMVKVKNPNNYKITVVDSDLELFIGNYAVGKAVICKRIVLPKRSEEVHKLQIKADFKSLLSGGLATLLSVFSSGSVNLQVKGTIKARAKMMTKRFPVDVSERVDLNQ